MTVRQLRRQPARGFTLLEALVTLLVTAAVAIALGRLVQSGTRAHTHITAKSAAYKARNDIAATLRQMLTSMRRIGPSGLTGTADSLSFLTQADPRIAQARPVYVKLNMAEDQLRVQIWQAGATTAETSAPDFSVRLTDALDTLSVSYLAQPAGETGEWLDQWSPAQPLPAAIRLSITTDTIPWPPIIVRPAQRSPVNCQVNFLTGTCL